MKFSTLLVLVSAAAAVKLTALSQIKLNAGPEGGPRPRPSEGPEEDEDRP
jgi:hypothetical protein